MLGETCLQKLICIATHHLSRSTLTSETRIQAIHQIQQLELRSTTMDLTSNSFCLVQQEMVDGTSSTYVRTAADSTSAHMAQQDKVSTITFQLVLTMAIHSVLESHHMTMNSTGSTLMDMTTLLYSTTRRMDKASLISLCTIHPQIHL